MNTSNSEFVESLLRPRMEKELLRYAVQRQIQCPHCGDILDVTRAILLEHVTTEKMAILCADCWKQPVHSGDIDHPIVGTVKIYDGRILFGKRKSRK